MLFDAILQRQRDPIEELLLLALLDGLDGEAWLEIAFGDYLFAGAKSDSTAGFDAANVGVEGLRLRYVLQVHIVLDGATIKAEV